jgi:sulfide dehydrogenase cytochrome subunit
MRRFIVTGCTLLCAVAAHAQDARGLAATCSGCHGIDARARDGMRALAGMPKDELARAMRAYRSGERPGTLMPQLAKGYTDAEIDAIAGWYAAAGPAR